MTSRIYPQRLQVETKSPAERRIYELLRDQLPNEYTVFHSVRWLHRDSRRGGQDGEADFVIGHPEHGLLVLEIKGGRIRYDGPNAAWFSNQYAIKDPFAQAEGNKYSLLDKLQEMTSWPHHRVTLGHAVGFPDSVVKRDLRLDAPREIILDAADCADIEGWLKEAFRFWRRQDARADAPGRPVIDALIEILCPRWELPVPLAAQVANEERTLVRLTEEQFRTLDLLSFQRRAAISGCAGSGKTTLAIEQSRRLAAQGFRVLLTCFNKPLAEYLRNSGCLAAGVDALHFHGVCLKFIEMAGVSIASESDQASQDFFNVILPGGLLTAVDALGPQYDAIVADEGQDLMEEWWVALQYLLREPDQGILYVFYDDNQRLYRERLQIPAGLPRFPLTRNCRNTRSIHNSFLPFYHSDIQPQAPGPVGRQPRVHFYGDERDLQRELGRLLHSLTVDQAMLPHDIVVLTPRSHEKSCLWRLGPYANYHLAEQPRRSNEIRCSTIHSFKGMESKVVVLAEIYPSSNQDLDTLLYVGCSRARHQLFILAEQDLPEDIVSRLSGSEFEVV